MASFATPFSSLVCVRTNYLAVKRNYYSLTGVWTEPGQWFFSQYCTHLLRKPVRTDLLLCDEWQTSCMHLLPKKCRKQSEHLLKMWQDVGIANSKSKETRWGWSCKQLHVSIQTPYVTVYVIIPTLFLYFLLLCYPYILLHFKVF